MHRGWLVLRAVGGCGRPVVILGGYCVAWMRWDVQPWGVPLAATACIISGPGRLNYGGGELLRREMRQRGRGCVRSRPSHLSVVDCHRRARPCHRWRCNPSNLSCAIPSVLVSAPMHPRQSLSPKSQPGEWPRLPRFGTDGAAGLAVPTAPPADQPLLALPAEDTGYSVTLCSSEAAADTGAERVWRGAFDDERRTKRAWVSVHAVWMGGDGPALAVALASARSADVLPLRVVAGGPITSSWRRLLTDPQLQKIACRTFDVKSAIGRAGERLRNLHDELASCGRKYRQVYTTLSAATTDLLNLALPHMMPLRHTDWEASKLFMWQARLLALYAFGVFRVAELVRAQYFPPGG